jgi:hypothetical protein
MSDALRMIEEEADRQAAANAPEPEAAASLVKEARALVAAQNELNARMQALAAEGHFPAWE